MKTVKIEIVDKAARFMFYAWMVLMGCLLYLRYYPVNPVELHEFSVVEETVRKGENITLIIDFDKKEDITPQVKFSLVNGSSHPLVSAGVSKPAGVNRSKTLKTIPDSPSILPGTYQVQVDLTYRINAFRPDKVITWTTEPFEVTE